MVCTGKFNVKYSVFPNSYIRRNKGIDLYDYYYIEYGNDNTELINERAQESAFLLKGIKLSVKDEKTNNTEVFHYDNGLYNFIEFLNIQKNHNALISKSYQQYLKNVIRK